MPKNRPANIRPVSSPLPQGFVASEHPGLQAYARLLTRWNSKMNLVGRQDIHNLWHRHIEDSLFLLSCLPALTQAPWVFDAGTGGGLPGMVLAIVDPERNYLLVDRSERKVRFLNQVVAELKLANVQTLCGDFTAPVDDAQVGMQGPAVPKHFGALCARAVAPPLGLWANLKHLLAPKGELLVACGPQTRAQLPVGVDVEWLPNDGAAEDRGVVRMTAGSE